MKSTRADLKRVLEILQTVPQSYHAEGPAVVVKMMERTIGMALADEFAGVAAGTPGGFVEPSPVSSDPREAVV